jgi:UDPglucose 6-dehydrogenase
VSTAVGFVGLSHLGLVSSVAAAAQGADVIGFDQSAELIDRLNAGDLPVVEPGLPELLAQHRGRVTFTADASALIDCEVVYVSIDVPTDDQDRGDIRTVEQLLRLVAKVTKPGTIVVVLSQVHPGFCRGQQPWIVAGGRSLYYQVETLIFGRAVERALRPERVIVGCDELAALLPPFERFLQRFRCPILPMRYESAELCKIGINMFLVASVSTTNMLAELCEAIGADWSEIAPALRLDRRIGQHAYLTPGLGLGGGNLTRDLATVKSLALEHGLHTDIIDAWSASSKRRRDWVLMMLHRHALDRPGAVIALWGLAYIPNTSSVKNSPALALIESLGPYSVRAYDPAVLLRPGQYPHVVQTATAIECCAGADALAIMTAWPEFVAADMAQLQASMRGRVIIDPWGMLNGRDSESHGFFRACLGARPAGRSFLKGC